MKKPNNDSKYFYIVVILTVLIAGFICWELFFADYKSSVSLNSEVEEIPKINMVYLDSNQFEAKSSFDKRDIPLFAWDKNKSNNPFLKSDFPQEEALKNWWSVFTIEFDHVKSGFEGASPSIIDNINNPQIILFEDRVYKISISNLVDKECSFTIFTKEGEELYSKDLKSDDQFDFRATENVANYGCKKNKERGEIKVIANEDYQLEGSGSIRSILEMVEEELSSFASQVENSNLTKKKKEEAMQKHNNFQERVNSLQEQYNQGDLTKKEFQNSVASIREEINSTRQELKESGLVTALDPSQVEEIIQNTSGKSLINEVDGMLSKFNEEISNIKDAELKTNAESVYSDLKTRFDKIKQRYENKELSDQELQTEINNFYNQTLKMINEAGL